MPEDVTSAVPTSAPAPAPLAAARRVYVAIQTRSGPHVTPELALWWRGRLWCFSARTTLKYRLVKRRPQVGLCGFVGDEAAVAFGDASVLDVFEPGTLLDALPEAALSGPAAARWGLRHLPNLAGYALDLASGRLGRDGVTPRALISVQPAATAVLDGSRVVRSDGAWPGSVDDPGPDPSGGRGPGRRGRTDGGSASAPDLDPLPGRAADCIGGIGDDRRRCVVGWSSRVGPLALPGWWDPARSHARVPAALFRLASLEATSPASITLDDDVRPGPGGKRGLVVRGEGMADVGQDEATITLDADKVTWWDGAETRTTEV